MLGHTSPIDTLAVNEDIIVSGCETSIRVWDRHTGNPIGFQGLGIKRKAADIALWEDKIVGTHDSNLIFTNPYTFYTYQIVGPLAPESRKRGQNFLYVAYQGGTLLVTLSITELGGPKVELWDFSGKLEFTFLTPQMFSAAYTEARVQSITARKGFKNVSFEELRLQFYQTPEYKEMIESTRSKKAGPSLLPFFPSLAS